MALCRYRTNWPPEDRQERWGWFRDGRVVPLDAREVQRTLVRPDAEGLSRLAALAAASSEAETLSLETKPRDGTEPFLVKPVPVGTEVWAAGVTYESSKFARMAESEAGGDFYARVYTAERPELFLKATWNRVVGPNGWVRIRADSAWNVPEPELAALIAADGTILGYTVGNDMSSRAIEGENPLYLPQAKVYRGSCALGPVIVPAETLDPQNLGITLTITRGGETAFTGTTSTARMRRTVADLAQWLFRENEFPYGVLLLTGTGIIPPDDFTLHAGDEIAIEIEGIGTLHNVVSSD